jgi:hypothetical protein
LSIRYAKLVGLKNGELLSAAEAAGFDVLLTVDQSIPDQQNFADRKIAFVSTACMLVADVLSDAFGHFLDRVFLGLASLEEGPMNVLESTDVRSSNDDFAAFLLQFQNRAGPTPSLRRTSAGTEVWPCAVTLDRAIGMRLYSKGNGEDASLCSQRVRRLNAANAQGREEAGCAGRQR